uniref:Coat protein n=1 Tax=Hosta virus X TaxID=214439 RepID=C1J932_9VIRU|nr:coat protein [Hosta virus X]
MASDAPTPPAAPSPVTFTAPTQEQLTSLALPIISTRLPSPDVLNQISVKWQELGVPTASISSTAIALCMACYHSGSSGSTLIPGLAPGTTVNYTSLAAAVKSLATLREFARYFAPIIWNYAIEHKIPPANWAAMGYKENTKYAAFDTFDSILNPAALQPTGGLIRQPTEEELLAHQANSALHIFDSLRNDFASTDGRVTRGHITSNVNPLNYLPAPEGSS